MNTYLCTVKTIHYGIELKHKFVLTDDNKLETRTIKRIAAIDIARQMPSICDIKDILQLDKLENMIIIKKIKKIK